MVGPIGYPILAHTQIFIAVITWVWRYSLDSKLRLRLLLGWLMMVNVDDSWMEFSHNNHASMVMINDG